jgi:hypothetical protein
VLNNKIIQKHNSKSGCVIDATTSFFARHRRDGNFAKVHYLAVLFFYYIVAYMDEFCNFARKLKNEREWRAYIWQQSLP